MPTEPPIYSHRDDDPHLTGDDLAAKVVRYIQYATFIDMSEISVMALGGMVVLSGNVAGKGDIACAGDAAASVIGVTSVENRLTVRPKAAGPQKELVPTRAFVYNPESTKILINPPLKFSTLIPLPFSRERISPEVEYAPRILIKRCAGS